MYYNFEYNKGMTIDENHDMHWPDGIDIHVDRLQALRIIGMLAGQLEDRHETTISFNILGTLEKDEESNDEEARMEAIRKGNDK